MKLVQSDKQAALAIINGSQVLQDGAEQSLSCFIEQAWHVIEPTTQYVPGKHIDAICEHLEAVLLGQINRLLINIPPRFSKSLTVSVFWFVWDWIKHPERRWIFSSYAQSLATRDSLACRRLIESQWYQSRWGDRCALTTDQNTKTRFENNKTGYRIAAGVGGSVTGEGGDILVVDDPHNVKDVFSDVSLATTTAWFDEVLSTRLNSQEEGAIVVIMQRISHKDLAEHILERGGYEYLCLPMEYESNRHCVTSIGWEDWRKKDGELLSPGRVGAKALKQLKTSLGSFGVAGQLQQRPSPRGGGMFKREWFEIVDKVPERMREVRYWDMAGTEAVAGKDPDYTAGVKMGYSKGEYCITDIQRFRESSGVVEKRIKQSAMDDGRRLKIRMEQEPGASGKDQIRFYQTQTLSGWDFKGDRASGSKELRANPLAIMAEAGKVKLLKGKWNKDFLDEIETFPAGTHDDQVDAASGAFNELSEEPSSLALVG